MERSLPLGHAVLADVSLVLLCLILVLGPTARLVPRARWILPWTRELGIAMFVTAALHTAMFIGPELDVVGWFKDALPGDQIAKGRLWVGAQWLGVGALAYATALALTSNNWSQRFLGRGWKFLQRQAYTLFVLTWLHTAAFLLFAAGHDPVISTGLFVAVTSAAVVAQFVGFGHTVLARRPRSTNDAAARDAGAGSVRRGRTARWIGVGAIWVIFVALSWVLSTTEFNEETDRVALMCDRYNELGQPVLSQEVRQDLERILDPTDSGEEDFIEAFQLCF